MIRISSKRHNFRRCGVAHPKEGTDHADDRFSAEELATLKAEPMLTVEEVAETPLDDGPKVTKDMTVAELKEELEGYQDLVPYGLKKAEYVEMVEAHREAKGEE